MNPILEQFQKLGIIPVVVIDDAKDAVPLAKALCEPMHCTPSGSSVHGIFQARILEWAGMPFLTQGSNLDLLHNK